MAPPCKVEGEILSSKLMLYSTPDLFDEYLQCGRNPNHEISQQCISPLQYF